MPLIVAYNHGFSIPPSQNPCVLFLGHLISHQYYFLLLSLLIPLFLHLPLYRFISSKHQWSTSLLPSKFGLKFTSLGCIPYYTKVSLITPLWHISLELFLHYQAIVFMYS